MKASLPKTTSTSEAERRSLLGHWHWWLPPALLSLALALLFQDPFIGDWDGLDYTVLAVRGQPSSMALGRSLFIFFNHALYLLAHGLFHLRAEHAYLLFKYTVIATAPLVVIACWALTRSVAASESERDANMTATIAALLVASSPSFIVYSGQVMTDVPSLLFVAVALVLHLKGLRERRWWMVLAGAALLGAGANVRETVAFYGPWLLFAPLVCGWRPRGRELLFIALSCLVFALFAFGPFLLWFWTDAGGFRAAWYGWRYSGQAEAARHPVTWRNLLPFLFYSFLLGPMVAVALPVAMWKEWRARGVSPVLLLALTGVWANALLFFNYSTIINWRYFLTGLPAFVPVVASYFLRSQKRWLGEARTAFLSVICGIAFVTVVMYVYAKPTSEETNRARGAQTRDYRERLMLLPPDAVVMAGAETVAVTYWRGLGLGRWTEIGTGAGWPTEPLDAVIAGYLKQGRRVFLDLDARFWPACGWQLEETLKVVELEKRFRFRRVSETIYEIRPPADESARDTPPLTSLLPENRPLETSRCVGLNKLR